MTPVLVEHKLAGEVAEQSSTENVSAVFRIPFPVSQLATLAAMLLLVLVAFSVRIYALERQSMWSDEGLSTYRAQQSPAEILEGLIIIDGVETVDTNPPIYFLLLHSWLKAMGNTIFSLRYSGVLLGTLAIPFIFALGSVIYGRWVGLVAALLMAISPLHVWQSQVLRNYSLLLTLNLASAFGLFRYLQADSGEPKKVRWLVLWMIAGLLGIYTHYFGLFVFAFGVLALMLWLVRRWDIRQILGQKRFWLAMLLGVLVLIPALMIGFERFRAGQQYDFFHVALGQVLAHAAGAFGVGVAPDMIHPWWRMLPALILAICGMLLGWRTHRQLTIILLGYQVVPLGLMLLLSIINPLYNGVRHLLIGLPPFLLFAANGAAGMWGKEYQQVRDRTWPTFLRWLLLIVFAITLIIQVSWLYRQFSAEDLLRDDIRSAAEYLNEVAEETDRIILHDTIIGFTFDYYYEGAAPWEAIPALHEDNVDEAEAALAAAGSQAERIWFLARPTPRTGFPRKAVWDWADMNWPQLYSHEFPSLWLRVQLIGYKPEPIMDAVPQEAAPVSEIFGEALHLHGVELPSRATAGQPWWATFYWSKLDPDDGDYIVSMRFIDEDGQLWGQDDDLLWHDYQPVEWPPEKIVGSDIEISLTSGVPPGNYDVWLRVMDNERRPLKNSDGEVDVFVDDIELLAGTECLALPSFIEQEARLGDVDFLGYSLPTGEIRPGHAIPIELFWLVHRTPAADLLLQIELVDEAGDVVAGVETEPTRKDHPASSWQAGELVQSKVMLNVPASAGEASPMIRVILTAPATGETVASFMLKDRLVIDSWPYVDELPNDLQLLNAEFGNPAHISLPGFDLPVSAINQGEMLDVTLYWQANADIFDPYHVFVHLLSDEESIVAQRDSAPVQGFRPTISWRAGEVIEDAYQVPISTEIAPGRYKLWAGLYQPETGERPLTVVDGATVPERRVYLGEITVEQAE